MRKTTLAILFFVVMICANCTWRTLPVQAGKEFEEGRAAYERRDYATAIKKLRSLAEAGNAKQGNAAVQFNLGWMYAEGQGVPQNKIVAYALYNLSAANDASNKMAMSFRNTLLDKMTPREIEVGQGTG
jgi:TPR repeat protein